MCSIAVNRHHALVASIVVFTLFVKADAHETHDHANDAAATSDFSFDVPDHTVAATILGKPLDYDGDIASVEGRLWYTWLEFVPGKGDLIWVGTRGDSDWKIRHCVISQHGQYASPTLTLDGTGRLWLSFEARNGDGWDVFVVPLRDGTAAAARRRISPGAGADIHHRMAAADGLWCVWQSDRDGQFDVVARRLIDDELQDLHVVGHGSFGDWHPSVASDSRGNVYVAWDAYDGESFNVRLRSFRQGQWSETFDVARSTAFEGRADIAVDPLDQVWIAWEEGGENWGLPFRGINTELVRDQRGPLHRFRLVRLAVLASDGALNRLADPLPMPSVRHARSRNERQAGIEKTGAFYERVKLAVDAAGRPWLAYRHYYAPWLGVAHRSHVEEGWGLYARCYTADGWSRLARMSVGQGDGLQRLELAAHDGGIAAVWTTGRTHRKPSKRPRGMVTASLSAEGDAPQELPLSPVEQSAAPSDAPRDPRPETMTTGGKRFQLFYGDLHRHTDLSLCRVPIDGTIDDAYRYAIEVARLDFLGITDHSRDIARGDALSQLWWRSRKQVYRHQLVDHDEMRFVPFYAYERSHGNTADHNVISLRGDMLRPHTYPVPEFWKELDENTITIPHQPIRRDTWKYQDDLLRPLVEIFQGCRDISIEEDVHRGLARGFHLGFIASSDHMSTSASYACVWAERPTREAVFHALRARRTFAATDKIWLAVHVDDHWMGEIIRTDEAPRIELRARGTAPIRNINLIVDGQPWRTFSPNRRDVELQVPLEIEGRHYAYFYLVQSDGNEAWSSPIWLDVAAVGERR